jgi:hypothetical protein
VVGQLPIQFLCASAARRVRRRCLGRAGVRPRRTHPSCAMGDG